MFKHNLTYISSKHWIVTLVFHKKQSLTKIVNSCFLEYFSGYCVIQIIVLY